MVNSDGFEKEDTWFGMNSYGKGGPPRNKHSESTVRNCVGEKRELSGQIVGLLGY